MDFEFSDQVRQNYRIRNLEFQIEQLHLKSNETFIVKISEGEIRGAKRYTVFEHPYYSFERIPYAKPPLGELRFRAPKPIAPWKNVLDCTHYGPKPVQRDFISGKVEGSEDCLHLNVYTNNLRPPKKRPVMVWIYGGGYAIGEANREYYAPDYFMMRDVVLVTIQYRLGPLGFLTLEDPNLHIPGNAGLKDMIMALKWVQRNCVHFGGNPECITLFGESAGAVSVHILMLSEPAKGLFHRAILQSGTITNDWDVLGRRMTTLELAQAAGYAGEFKEELILDFLVKCTAKQIVDAQQKCKSETPGLRDIGPCLETHRTQQTIWDQPLDQLFNNAWGNEIPLILGATSNEGLFFKPFVKLYPQIVDARLNTCEMYVPQAAIRNRDSQECRQNGLKLRKLHVKGEKPTVDEYCEVVSFAIFWHPMQKAINSRLNDQRACTYLYRFDFASDMLMQPFRLMRLGEEDNGVAHAEELSYLFYNALANRMERQSREFHTIERMIGLWTVFAETGDPNAGTINGMEGVEWRPLLRQDTNWKCLNIGDELRFTDLPEMSKLRGWQQLYNEVGQLPV